MFHTIDLLFQGVPEVIASYVFRGDDGVVLLETGPRSTAPRLKQGLAEMGIVIGDVTDILVTHIHLDHSGAAGRLAQESGATVYVHEVGAPHLANPSRLLTSATRLYGEQMDRLWGETLPVPQDQIIALSDGDIVEAAGLQFKAVDTPGHAFHHMAYLVDGLCFSGDVAGVRLPGYKHVRLPTPPPEINPPLWQSSLLRLQTIKPDKIIPTHFGVVVGDVQDHLQRVSENLDAYIDLIYPYWQNDASETDMAIAFQDYAAAQAVAEGVTEDGVQRYEVIVPSAMQAPGLTRYLKKQV